LRREARSQGNFFREPQAKLAFVIRIKGFVFFFRLFLFLLLTFLDHYLTLSFFFSHDSILGVSPKSKKILRLLRLRQLHNGTFVRLTKATLNMLKYVEPYVAWGYETISLKKQNTFSFISQIHNFIFHLFLFLIFCNS